MVPWLARDDIAFARTGHFDDAAATATAWSAGDARVSRRGRVTHHMGTPMISQIFRRGVYHLSCDRAPIVGREISPAPPRRTRARFDVAGVNFEKGSNSTRAGDGTGRDDIATVLFGNRVTRNLQGPRDQGSAAMGLRGLRGTRHVYSLRNGVYTGVHDGPPRSKSPNGFSQVTLVNSSSINSATAPRRLRASSPGASASPPRARS